jgi:uncharacterized protein (DUF1330 family)
MIAFTDDDLDRFLAEDPGGPVVMLNLLRFLPDGGRERYGAYVQAVGDVLARHGGEILYAGDGLSALAAEEGQAWDTVALVRYPDRGAFAAMVRDPAYRAAEHLRTEALVEAVLQPTVPLG